MEIVPLGVDRAQPIELYESQLASSVKVAAGDGQARVYVVHLEPGGEIGAHEAGFGQVFYAASGSGWVAGGDGRRVPLPEGAAAFIRRGEVHAKGSDTGMTAVMVQVRDLTPAG